MVPPADGFDDRFHDAFGAGVAVVDRIVEHRAAGADQAEVDAPGVDADPVELRASRRRAAEPFLQVLPLAHEVPAQVPGHPPVRVGEPVPLVERELLAVKHAELGAAAFGAEVEGQEMFGHGFLRS